jgi:hypothetical protein
MDPISRRQDRSRARVLAASSSNGQLRILRQHAVLRVLVLLVL